MADQQVAEPRRCNRRGAAFPRRMNREGPVMAIILDHYGNPPPYMLLGVIGAALVRMPEAPAVIPAAPMMIPDAPARIPESPARILRVGKKRRQAPKQRCSTKKQRRAMKTLSIEKTHRASSKRISGAPKRVSQSSSHAGVRIHRTRGSVDREQQALAEARKQLADEMKAVVARCTQNHAELAYFGLGCVQSCCRVSS